MTALFTKASSVSTHSPPKVAAIPIFRLSHLHSSFQHTATRRRLQFLFRVSIANTWFQHTATRRRLLMEIQWSRLFRMVSTHSHPKAAAVRRIIYIYKTVFQHTATRRRLRQKRSRLSLSYRSFNTQPPEGGCYSPL